MREKVQLVWFKRDLRAMDHRALAGAAAQGPVLPLFIAEPELWQGPDHSARQWSFVRESLLELREALAALGQPLVVRTGDVLDVFEAIEAERGVAGLWSHEETGNGWTYARDRRVADWCAARAIPWHEPRQSGVIRRLKSRNGWARRWDRFMGEAVTPAPALEPLAGIPPGAIPSAQDMGLPADPCPGRQTAGAPQALKPWRASCIGAASRIARPCRALLPDLSTARACRRILPGARCRCARLPRRHGHASAR